MSIKGFINAISTAQDTMEPIKDVEAKKGLLSMIKQIITANEIMRPIAK